MPSDLWLTIYFHIIYIFLEPFFDQIILKPVDHVLRVYTDGYQVYNILDERESYQHFVVIHVETFGEGLREINHIEGFWSQLKTIFPFDSGVRPANIVEIFYL